MNYNHRMQRIGQPHLNARNELLAYEQEVRSRMQRPHASEGFAGLEGHSEMGEERDPEEGEGYSDRDLGAFDVAVNPAVRAFQESGHGVRVFEGHEGQ